MTRAYDFSFEGASTEVVSAPDDLAALAPEWDALVARDPEAGLFLSPRWLLPVLAARPGIWLIVTAREATGRLIGLLPLWRRRLRHKVTGAPKIEIDAAGRLMHSVHTGFVCDPVAETEALKAIGREVRRLDWTEFALPFVRQGDRLDRFAAGFDAPRYRVGWPDLSAAGADLHRTWQIALPPEARTLCDVLSPGQARRIARARQAHLDRGTLRIEDAAGTERFEAALELASTDRPGETSARPSRLGAALQTARVQGLLAAPSLFDGARCIATLFSVADARTGRNATLFETRDRQRREVPASPLLHAAAIEIAIRRGCILHDFGSRAKDCAPGFGAAEKVSRTLFVARTDLGAA